jgi:serine/threonine protein kinase
MLIVFSPRAYPPSISHTSVHELRKCLLDMVTALCYLHSKNIVHHDVRWDNIQYFEGNYYLIDLDEASDVKINIPGRQGLEQNSHAPEISSIHDWRVDIWSIGHLIVSAGDENAHIFSPLSESCLHSDPNVRWNLEFISEWLLGL